MILVTGGTGLVGSHLLLELTKESQAIRAIYRSKDRISGVEKLFTFAKAESRFSKINWIRADITDLTELSAAFQGIQTVYHCAALISFDPYLFDQLIKINVEGTANVVNLCLAQEVTKLCYLSTIASLGKLPNTPINEENHWDPNEENSVYAISKYGAETEVWRASQEGLTVLVFNPGVILGEGSLEEGSGKLFKRVLKNNPYYPTGGTAFIDVKDLVLLMVDGMASSLKNKRFVTIAGNYSYKYILSEMAKSLAKKAPTKSISRNKLLFAAALDKLSGFFTRKRKLSIPLVDSASYVQTYDNQKLKDALSFKPTPIKNTIQRVAVYHKKGIL